MTVTNIATPLGERITTDRTLAADLRASLATRGYPAGVTFGDFIAACRAAGVRDSDALGSIEYGIAQGGSGRIVIDLEDDATHIQEIRP